MTTNQKHTRDSDLFSSLVGQPRVRSFLESVVEQDSASHAYLFLGSPGTGKTQAAWLLAQALVCEWGGCNSCDNCMRVKRKSHPDVHYLEPEGVDAYLIEQIRDLIDDVNRKPIRASKKVYIISRADLLHDNTANALLKTLEEPPEGVYFILIGRVADMMLPTITSRCQEVPFRTLPPSKSLEVLMSLSGATEDKCRQALAVKNGSVAAAREYLLSSTTQATRALAIRTLANLACSSELDVLDYAKELLSSVKAPLTNIKEEQEQLYKENQDVLSSVALKKLAQRQKRELTNRERAGMIELLSIFRSFLRDVILVALDQNDKIVNRDVQADILRVIQSGMNRDNNRGNSDKLIMVDAATKAIDAIQVAAERLEYNVSPQLVLEVLLFDMREVLSCQPLYR